MIDLRTIQLKDANERLVKSERFAAIGELAGMVGHDLRNPLAGIKNATYFLKKKGSALSEEQSRAMLENIEKGIEHSDKIINDLLEYAGEIHLELQVISAHTILENVLYLIKIPDTVKIVNEIPKNLTVRVDQNKIGRVFINLVKNAIDAMPKGGTVTIKCEPTKDLAEISVADTGTGIPKDVLPKMFTPLFTTKAQGMGFGLAICKRVVEAHGGKISVETTQGVGTTFKVTLPNEAKKESTLKRSGSSH
jgi:signal transduction histidine kinase